MFPKHHLHVVVPPRSPHSDDDHDGDGGGDGGSEEFCGFWRGVEILGVMGNGRKIMGKRFLFAIAGNEKVNGVVKNNAV